MRFGSPTKGERAAAFSFGFSSRELRSPPAGPELVLDCSAGDWGAVS